MSVHEVNCTAKREHPFDVKFYPAGGESALANFQSGRPYINKDNNLE